MSFAGALEILLPTLPSYIALTKYDLLRITKDSFEFDPYPAAPPIAVEMAKAVFTLGASSCTESYVMSRTLAEGPKVFAFDALTCEALENFDLSVSTADYLQPFPSVVIELPADYTRKRVVGTGEVAEVFSDSGRPYLPGHFSAMPLPAVIAVMATSLDG
jgi:hypothetical protein